MEKYNSNIVEVCNLCMQSFSQTDGETRLFDIIDYYMHTDLEPKEFMKVMKNYDLTPAQVRPIKSMLGKFVYDKPINLEKVLNTGITFGAKTDSKGNYIEGSGYTLTKGDKLSIIEYLQSHNIPVTEATYRAGCLRFKEGILFENQKDGIKTYQK